MQRFPALWLAIAVQSGCSSVALAQRVPGRDLWDFPVGALADAPALAGVTGGGLYNPSSPLQAGRPKGRMVIGVTALEASADQGVEGQIVHGTWFRGPTSAFTISVARSAVGGIVRTGTDPQGQGNVPYDSWVTSIGSAHSVTRHLVVGAAARYRTGRADAETGQTIAADLGLTVQHLPLLDARLGVSSFLWRPGREIDDRSAASVALDARVLGPRDARGLRVGTSRQWSRRGASETFTSLRARFDVLELVAGSASTRRFGDRNARARFGVNFHFARYSAGISREDGVSRLAPTYQFSLHTLLP
ncbi:MAG: hypothetical protein MUF53_12570 [Gemmatimonadaceae bacterium]|nr:hypothetical protein [Gemmatimonadaceae bacterium]